MNTEIKFHSVQLEILRTLLFKPVARFSELNQSGLTNDHFSFHIKKLVDEGLVERKGGRYTLTSQGKEFANRMDTESVKIERQAKVAVLVVGINDKSGRKYLVQQRLKQPFFGFHGFVTGKVRWGEKLNEAAVREFEEETGMVGKPTLVGVEHKIDKRGGVVLEDKYFYVFGMENLQGDLETEFEGGRNMWMGEEEIRNCEKLFGDIFDILDLIKGGSVGIIEREFEVSEY